MGYLENCKVSARTKIELEDTEKFRAECGDQIPKFLLSWLDYDDNAAVLIAAGEKTLYGAFKAIRDYASKHKAGSCAYVPPEKAMELVLEYFGQEEPQAVIEGGLMYKVMMDEAARFKPYGTETPESEAEITESGTESTEKGTDAPETETVTSASEQKTQPVAKTARPCTALDVAKALGNISLEDLGL